MAAGEGSKGGKVIGHTKSGKPVYQNFLHPAHEGFSPLEHGEAASHHFKNAKDAHKRGDLPAVSLHADAHRYHSNKLMSAAGEKPLAIHPHPYAYKSLGGDMDQLKALGIFTESQSLIKSEKLTPEQTDLSVQVVRKGNSGQSAGEMLEEQLSKGYMVGDLQKAAPKMAPKAAPAVAGKAGEGSKGGKVIGHTKSGKPVYESGNKGAKGWSSQDHMDAFQHHHELSVKHRGDMMENPRLKQAREHDKDRYRTPEEGMALVSQHRHTDPESARAIHSETMSDHHYGHANAHYDKHKKLKGLGKSETHDDDTSKSDRSGSPEAKDVPELKDTHGEEFHSDNDKQVEKWVTEVDEVKLDDESPKKKKRERQYIADELEPKSALNEIFDLIKGEPVKKKD